MRLLRYTIYAFFTYLVISLTLARLSVEYLEKNQHLLENFINNSQNTQIKVTEVTGDWRGVYPSLLIKIKNLDINKKNNISLPELVDLKINIYKSVIFFKPVIKSIYIENVRYKNSFENIIKKLKNSKNQIFISVDDIQIGKSKFQISYKGEVFNLNNTNIILRKNNIYFDTNLEKNKKLKANISDLILKDGSLVNLKYKAQIDGDFDYEFKNFIKDADIKIKSKNLNIILSGEYSDGRFKDNKITIESKDRSQIAFNDHYIKNLNSKIIFGNISDNNIGFEFNELYFLSKNDHPYELIESAVNYNKTKRDVSIFIKNINIDTEKLKKDFDLFLDNKLFFTSNLKDFKIKFNFDKPLKDYYFSGLFINTNFVYKNFFIDGFTGNLFCNSIDTLVSFDSRDITINDNVLLRNKLKFKRVTGDIRITNYANPITYLSDFKLSNDKLDVTFTGFINKDKDTIKVSSYIDYVDMRYITDYLPKSFMTDGTANYFKNAFLKGSTKSGNVYIDGSLSKYPLYDDLSGISYAKFPINDLDVDYKKGWIPFKKIKGIAYFKNRKAFFKSENFKILDTVLSGGDLYIDDVKDTELWINGQLNGPFRNLIEFSNEADLTKISEKKIKKIDGNSQTDFKIKIAFNNKKNFYQSKIKLKNVSYTFDDKNKFKNIFGEIIYKNNKFFTKKDKFINADYNKIKIKFDLVTNSNGDFVISGIKNIDISKYIKNELVNKNIVGKTNIQYNIKFPNFNSKSSTIKVKLMSNLNGILVSYPKPFFKEKNQEIPSNLSFQINNSKLENFKISYNNIFAELLSLENLVGYINFSGKQSKIPDSNINLMGTINEFNLDEWKNLSSDNDINYLSYVNKVDVFFKKFINDKLIMDNLKIKGYSTQKIFLFNEISAINNYLQLKASGNVEFNNISTFKINLNTKNLENLLNYWNFNHSLRDASMKSDLDISWKGGLFDFSLKGAYGKFSTNMKDGRLKKVGNRATRIFGLFNIDLLAKRLSLDFDDVTKNGFYFNSLNGDFRLDSGNIFTTNLLIKGPSAELLTVGTTNYIDETYDMQVIASPEFGETLPAIALLGGPITAAATFAAEKLAKAFGRDINDLIKIKYKVSGTWDEPKIKIINKKTDALDNVEELFE